MHTKLYIENIEIELDESTQFLLNKEFEQLPDPTKIINSWSKTVSIPFTEKNNRTFGYFYKPEKVIISDGTADSYKRMKQYFDPTKKLDFKLVYNSAVLMTGYAKINLIPMDKYNGKYELTLFGTLGKIFQELKKITFDTTTEDTSYLIHGEDYVDEFIDRNLVYNSWTSYGQQRPELLKKTDANYDINDIIGFAPNNSFCEGFDYKTVLVSTTNASLFSEILINKGFVEATGINADTAIPNGLTPRGIGEYRSYQQLPYIYWNKLFKIFREKAEEVTGYDFVLDSSFFNVNNPDWYKLVYMLKAFQSTGQTSEPNYKNTYGYWLPGSGYLYWGSAGYTQTKSATAGATVHIENTPILDVGPLSPTGYTFDMTDFSGRIVGDLPCSFRYLTYEEYYQNSQLSTNNGFVFTLNVIDEDNNNTTISSAQYLLCRSDTTIDKTPYRNIIENDSTSIGYDAATLTDRFDFTIPINAFIPRGHKIHFLIAGKFVNSNVPMSKVGGGGQMWLPTMNLYLRTNELTINLAEEVRSNSHFILNDLWNKDFNLFGEIIKYCKMYRIYVYLDDINKKIYFKQYNKYFENYTIEDWTDKVDRSKDFILKPITFDNKYVLFNYADDKTRLGETYREKYGFNIGEYRLNTDYNFNDKTTKLFDGIKCSINNTDNVLSWTNIYDNKRVVYSFPSEIFVYCKNKDDKYTDVFGRYYYYAGRATFSTEAGLYMRPVKITDDTLLQMGTNTFFYSQQYNYAIVTTYPQLDIVYGDNICLFNNPKENYTYINNYEGKNSLYTKYWKNYIDERYSIQNRLITCYLTLTPKDWMNFEFNKFIKIDNIIYMINKIYDYNIEVPEATKVDLISITDIEGYTK